jgi:hypothetical protein
MQHGVNTLVLQVRKDSLKGWLRRIRIGFIMQVRTRKRGLHMTLPRARA